MEDDWPTYDWEVVEHTLNFPRDYINCIRSRVDFLDKLLGTNHGMDKKTRLDCLEFWGGVLADDCDYISGLVKNDGNRINRKNKVYFSDLASRISQKKHSSKIAIESLKYEVSENAANS